MQEVEMRSAVGPKPALTGALTGRQQYEGKRHVGTPREHKGGS